MKRVKQFYVSCPKCDSVEQEYEDEYLDDYTGCLEKSVKCLACGYKYSEYFVFTHSEVDDDVVTADDELDE